MESIFKNSKKPDDADYVHFQKSNEIRLKTNARNRSDVSYQRLQRLRSIQRFSSGAFVVPCRSLRCLQLTILSLGCSLILSIILEYFGKERAEIYWCYNSYEVGQLPCSVRDESRIDRFCIGLFLLSSATFLLSFLPWSVINYLHGADRQRSVAMVIMKRRKQRIEKLRRINVGSSDISLEKCLILGGFEARQTEDAQVTLDLTYWEAVKEELYTRVFSIVPSEIYCNWVHGHKCISLIIGFLSLSSLFAHFLVSLNGGPIYVECWIFIASIGAFIAPFQALVWITPLLFGSKYRTEGLTAAGIVVLTKVFSLVTGKRSALGHEQRLLKHFFRNTKLWAETHMKEKVLLYLLGFNGFF